MRFVPRGFVHLSGLISFNEDIERLSVTVLGVRATLPWVSDGASGHSWSDIRGRITRGMADNLT